MGNMKHVKLFETYIEEKDNDKWYPKDGDLVKILTGKNKGEKGRIDDMGKNEFHVLNIKNDIIYKGRFGDDINTKELKPINKI